MNRIIRYAALLVFVAVCVSALSFAVQVIGIRRQVELAEKSGSLLLICRLPYDSSILHGAVSLAALSLAPAFKVCWERIRKYRANCMQ